MSQPTTTTARPSGEILTLALVVLAAGAWWLTALMDADMGADIITLPDGFIWTDGDCGLGSFSASAEGVALDFADTNWIHYEFNWTN